MERQTKRWACGPSVRSGCSRTLSRAISGKRRCVSAEARYRARARVRARACTCAPHQLATRRARSRHARAPRRARLRVRQRKRSGARHALDAPAREGLRVEHLVALRRRVAAARLAALGRVHGEAQARRVHVVAERLHAGREALRVAAQLLGRRVARRRLLLPAVIHVHARVAGRSQARRDEPVRDALVERLADALGRRLVRAVVRRRVQVAAEDLPRHPERAEMCRRWRRRRRRAAGGGQRSQGL